MFTIAILIRKPRDGAALSGRASRSRADSSSGRRPPDRARWTHPTEAIRCDAVDRAGEKRASPGEARRTSEVVIRRIRLVIVVASFAGALLAVALSLVSYEALKSHLDTFTVDRDADVSRVEFDAIVRRLRVLAVGLVVLAGLLVAGGRTLDRAASDVACAWWQGIRGAPAAARSFVAHEEPMYLAGFGIAIVVAALLRIAFLDVPLRYDEATTYNNFVSKPLYVGLAHYPLPNNHLLHTFLANISVNTFGSAAWAIRLPALLAGIALVPATFALARILYGRAAAVLAAALVASSSTLVEYSTNARGYTLVALFTLVAFIAATRVLDNDSIGAWAVIAAAGALGLYAVPVMLYPLGGVLVWLLLSRVVARAPVRPLLWRLGFCVVSIAVLTLVLYAPVFAASGIRSVTSNEYVEPQSWATFFDRLPDHIRDTFATWDRDLPLVVSVVLLIGLAGGLALTPRLSRYPVPPLVATIAWIVPVVVVQRVVPFTRVWLSLVPLALAVIAAFYGRLLERLPRSRLLVPVGAAVIAIGTAWAVLDADSVRESRETGALLDAPAVASYLARNVEPGDRIFATGSDVILEYYLAREGIDARPFLYTSDPRARTFLVVNLLGGQRVEDYVRELDASLAPPELLRRFRSAEIHLVEPS